MSRHCVRRVRRNWEFLCSRPTVGSVQLLRHIVLVAVDLGSVRPHFGQPLIDTGVWAIPAEHSGEAVLSREEECRCGPRAEGKDRQRIEVEAAALRLI